MTDKNHDSEHDGNERSLAKKGTIAAGTAGAAAIGATATAAAQDGEEALVFSYDYFPGASFEVISALQQSTTVEALQVDGEPVSEISQPDDWSGYVIRYDMDAGDSAGVTTFLFGRDVGLSTGDSDSLSEDAQMFSPELNLLSSDLG